MTPQQLKQTNILFNRLEYLENKENINDSIINVYSNLVNQYEIRDSLSAETLNKQDTLLKNWQSDYINLEQEYLSTKKQCKKATGFATGGGILSICLITLLILL